MMGTGAPTAARKLRNAAGVALLALASVIPAAGAPVAKSAPENAWVSISYRELLDPEAITHSGARLVDAIRRKESRGEAQPFLDPYSSLLGYAVQMLSGADPVSQTSLTDRYPEGSAQPAWVALLREGKYFVSADGRGRARVFVPGDDPRSAYRGAYSVLRHPLSAALPTQGQLQVEVYAYHNDFAATELRLNPAPYRFRSRSFPPRGLPLNLGEYEAFFRKGGQLEGAELTPEDGLVLYASQTQRQSLRGEPVSLADLAVAYRAVFHAGESEAFVSLDRNSNPTLATVNFGGLLQDTRIGKAVLAADMRFKTICSGLDSETFADVREKIRRAVPSFMSNSERRFLSGRAAKLPQWIFARYWYYPDSCGVETDDENRLAAITKTQLTADVERVNTGSAAKGGKPVLPTFFLENIRELNKNYGSYASVFPEYRDLSSAARLMALTSWLGRVRPDWIDLDGLLAVNLPPESTLREVPQLISAEIIDLPEDAPPDRDYVFRNLRVQDLTTELNKSVSEFFGSPQQLAAFLAFQDGEPIAQTPEFAVEANRLFPTVQDKRVRDLLKTTADLQAFLRIAAARLLDQAAGVQPADLARDEHRVNELRVGLAALPSGPAAGEGADDPSRQRLERELQEIMRKYHAKGPRAGVATVVATQYTGGVSLAPRLFDVKKSNNRPALEKFKVASRTAGTTLGTTGWIRSRKRPAAPARVSAPPAKTSKPSKTAKTPKASKKERPQSLPGDSLEEIASPPASDKPAMRSITVPGSATPAGLPLIGLLGDGRRIVFTRSPR